MTLVWLAIGLGLAVLAITAPLRWSAAIVAFWLPFSGTVVAIVGGSTPILVPVVVVLGFLARHAFSLLIRPVRQQFFELVRGDGVILAFAAYCLISGLLFPRLFEGATNIMPQEWIGHSVVLGPGSISLPQLTYFAVAIYLYLAMRQAMLRVGLAPILYALGVQVAVIGGIGVLQALLGLAGGRFPLEWIVNNRAYGILIGAAEGGFVRVTSVFVESSFFAAWGSGALAFTYALYVNRIRPWTSLALMGVVAVAMLLSTSSTAYFGILCVGMFAVVHAFTDTDRMRRDRGLIIVAIGALVAAITAILVFTAQAGFLSELREMIERMTLGKSNSFSSQQRGEWQQISIQNALDTGLLGVGYGVARSSGIMAALFGTIGLPGMVLFALVVVPAMLRAFRRPRTGEDAVASAGAFGLFGAIAAMSVSAPDISLANNFWMFLALASAPLTQRALMHAQEPHGEPMARGAA